MQKIEIDRYFCNLCVAIVERKHGEEELKECPFCFDGKGLKYDKIDSGIIDLKVVQ